MSQIRMPIVRPIGRCLVTAPKFKVVAWKPEDLTRPKDEATHSPAVIRFQFTVLVDSLLLAT
jgi:hypothetical protein